SPRRSAYCDSSPVRACSNDSVNAFHASEVRPRAISGRLIAIHRTASRGGSRVFALAAGHLRELETSEAVRIGALREFVAMDQDQASLAVVARDYARLGVQTIDGSVRQILGGKTNLGGFDFV